jgi:hypothetical protein
MTTVLLIIASCAFVAVGVSRLITYLSYSDEEERTPVENYDLVNPKKSKIKKVTKSKTKK